MPRTMRMTRTSFKWCVLSIALPFLTIPAHALTTNWTNAAGGSWTIPGNWSHGVPGINDTAAIQLGGTYSVTVTVSVNIEMLLLGGASGTQTLRVLNNFDCGQTSLACSIGVNGFLELIAPFTTSTTGTVGLVNHGQIILRQDDGILNMSSTRLDNYATGSVILEGLCAINDVTSFENSGELVSLGAESVVDGDVNNLSPAGLISVGEYLSTHTIVNDAVVWINTDSELYLDSTEAGAPSLLDNNSGALIELHPGSEIRGRFTNIGDPSVENSGKVEVIDSTMQDNWATIRIPYSQYSPDGLLSLLSGKLELQDTTYLDDSLNVAAPCTLKVHGLAIPGTGKAAGSGVIHFAGDPANIVGTAQYVRGTWNFSGDFVVTAADSFPTTVDFAADGGPATVPLRAAKLLKAQAKFRVLPYPGVTVRIDTIIQHGGELNGLVEPQALYHWTRGTLTSDSSDDFVIPSGATLLMDSTYGKTIEKIAMVIEGTATFAGSGVLTLADSARLASQPMGILNFESGFEMTGSGDLYNSGECYLDALSDTIVIDAFVTNTTLARSPGTIDILSGKTLLAKGGVNFGTIYIRSGATLLVDGSLINYGIIYGQGRITMLNGGIFTNGTYNGQSGQLLPGLSPGVLTIDGSVSLDSGSTLQLEITGPTVGIQYDQLDCNGSVRLGGTLDLQLSGEYVPTLEDTFQILNFASATDSFDEVTGTAIGNGQFLEISYNPNGISNYVCNGVSNLTVPAFISDTILQASAPIDTLEIGVTNSGHCPLTYSVTVGALSPASPVWLSVIPSSQAPPYNPLRRELMREAKLRVNSTGGPSGTYTGSITIHSNDPDDSVRVIPLTLEVIHEPVVWDIGGGAMDFADFTAAVNFLNTTTIGHPQVFDVYPGIYNESISLTPVVGASAANTITFQRKLLEEATRIQSSAAHVLRLNGADHIIWDGIDITLMGTGAGSAIVDTAGADSNFVRNCLIDQGESINTTQGIRLCNAGSPAMTNDCNVFENLTIDGFTTAIQLGTVTGVFPSQSNNRVRECDIQNCGSGVVLGCQRKLAIELAKISLSHPAVSTVRGIQVGQLNNGDTVQVRANTIHDLTGSTAYGIYAATQNSNSMVDVCNNMIYGWSAGTCAAIIIIENSRANVHFNSIYMNENPGAVLYYGIGGGEGANITISNNILYSEVSSASSTALAMGAVVTFNTNHNCFYSTGPLFNVGRVNLSYYPSLAAWQSIGHDSNSVYGYPGFASQSDLHIDGYYTTCNAQALPVSGITSDIDGQPRDPIAPDMGADEFTGFTGPISNLVARRVSLTNTVMLNWEAVNGALSYLIYRSTDPTALAPVPMYYIGRSAVSSYADLDVIAQPGLKFFYLVRPSTLP